MARGELSLADPSGAYGSLHPDEGDIAAIGQPVVHMLDGDESDALVEGHAR
jgi:hypothetical protein